MSLLPYILDDFRSFRPSRILEQHFGMGLDTDDFLSPFAIPNMNETLPRVPGSYFRPWCTHSAAKDTGSVVSMDKDKFEVNLDVQHFSPNEIAVKVTADNTITIEGKHDEKQDDHGFISRHFVRKYMLPQGHDIEQVVSNLSSDGVLTITAPKTGHCREERMIPIQQTVLRRKASLAKGKVREKVTKND